MNVIKASKRQYYEVEMDIPGRDERYFLRLASGKWLYLSGLSWEEPSDPDELEAAFQQWKKKKKRLGS